MTPPWAATTAAEPRAMRVLANISADLEYPEPGVSDYDSRSTSFYTVPNETILKTGQKGIRR